MGVVQQGFLTSFRCRPAACLAAVFLDAAACSERQCVCLICVGIGPGDQVGHHNDHGTLPFSPDEKKCLSLSSRFAYGLRSFSKQLGNCWECNSGVQGVCWQCPLCSRSLRIFPVSCCPKMRVWQHQRLRLDYEPEKTRLVREVSSMKLNTACLGCDIHNASLTTRISCAGSYCYSSC